LLLDSVTLAPPAGAAFEIWTLQLAVLLAPSVVGVQDKDNNVTGATRETGMVFTELPSVAVRVALWSVEMTPAVAVKDPLVDPAGTVTTEGTLKPAALLEIATVAPPAGAAALSVTVQSVDPPAFNKVAAHPRLLS
jgi:hypothetical protein